MPDGHGLRLHVGQGHPGDAGPEQAEYRRQAGDPPTRHPPVTPGAGGEKLGPGAARWPGAAGPLGAGQARELRPAWYVTFGAAAVVLVGVSTAAFLAGGGTDQPGPRVTPAVDTYLMQHDIVSGVAPVTSARYGPRPAATPSQSFSPPAP